MSENAFKWIAINIGHFVSSTNRRDVNRFVPCLTLFVAVLCLPAVFAFGGDRPLAASSSAQTPGPDSEDDQPIQSKVSANEIDRLIALLDSRDFALREQASIDLASLGESVIGPLAYHSFNCSPETGWRIKKTLENICTGGSEPVFLKAVAILKLRFNLGSSNNPQLAQSLARLETEWRERRKLEVISKLRQLGATVVDSLEKADTEFPRVQVLGGANWIILNGELVDVEGNVAPKSSFVQRRSTAKKLSEKKLKAKIKVILESNIDENRELVFGSANSADEPVTEIDPIVDRNRAAKLALQNQIRVNRMIQGRQNNSNKPGVSIAFDQNWKGQPEDFKLLEDVEGLQQMTFANQSISNDSLKRISSLSTLTKLTFDDCEFENRGLRSADWRNLNEIELKNQAITRSLMESCATIPLLRSMTFTACKIKANALEELSTSKQLKVLQFNEIELEDSVFESLAELKQLNYVNLTVCKFRTVDYKSLAAARPKLQIQYTAQAFFGVRGPVNNMAIGDRIRFDDNGQPINASADQGVSITEVIAGSGAQKAGMQVGDVIESVNGQVIEKFEDLRLHIAQHRVGDKLDVTVLRDKKPVNLKVVLGSQKSAPRFEP